MISTPSITLQIRTEVFDHGSYPAAASNFNITILNSIIKELHGASSIEYKITRQQWCEKVKKKIPSLSEEDAGIYFITFKTLFGDLETTSSKAAVSPKESSDKTVDIRYFAVYMWTHLFAQNVKTSTEVRKNLSNTPWPSYVFFPYN